MGSDLSAFCVKDAVIDDIENSPTNSTQKDQQAGLGHLVGQGDLRKQQP